MSTVNFVTHETGDASEYLALSGTASIQSSVARTGTYALRCNPTVGGTGYGRLQALSADGTQGSASIKTCYVRFYFQFLTAPSSGENLFAILTSKLAVQITTAGKLIASHPGVGTIATGTTVLSSGTWYRIEVLCGTDASSANWEILINGVSELSGNASWMTSNAVEVTFGKNVNNNNKSVDFYYDDILWSDSAYPGAGQGMIALPTADGFYTAGAANGAATLWGCLNQVPSDGDTTYIDSFAINDVYTAKVSAIAAAQINSVKPLIITRNLGSGGSHELEFRSGSVNSATTAVAAGSSYAPYAKLFDTDPNTSAAWTPGALSMAQVGMAQTVAGNRLTSAFLLADIATGQQPNGGSFGGVGMRMRRHGLRFRKY